ncbi:hypothetical protein VIBNISOn1_p0220 [Vibrio nigripulchritudo SOn1]|uniref:Uncharacterized protein n=1 Tax=Vibrio nigripulchritudo SOn1 TaxID=1238450 RepID=A0AAV2W017_9VIBR|nr:hypothetical protein VIBNISOn1_p0220 [Vibrio nigripulchritudo SOn1]
MSIEIPSCLYTIDKESGEETLKLAIRDNHEEIAVHVLVDPDDSLVKPVCLYLFWKKDEEQAKSTATDAKALLFW